MGQVLNPHALLSCTTLFLWCQIDQMIVKNNCRYFIFSSSMCLCLCSRMALLTHCWTDTSSTSEDWIANWEPYQQALEKGQCKKRWVADSSSESHRGHRPTLVIPLLFRVWKVGRLSWRSLQIQLHIFKGTLTFQRTFHTPGWGGRERNVSD